MQILNWKKFMYLAGREEIVPNKSGMRGREADGITIAQQKCLNRFGIGHTGLKYKGQASIIIGIAIERSNAHMATPGQMWALERSGYKMMKIKDMTFEKASFELDKIGYTR